MKLQTNYTRCRIGLVAAIVTLATGSVAQAALALLPGDTATYAVLYEGAGNNTLSINSSPIAANGNNSILGNVGLGIQNGGNPKFQLNNPAVIAGNINFAATTANFSNANGVLNGSVNSGVTQVTQDLNDLNALSVGLGALPGTALTINGTQTISASTGTFDSTFDSYVFNLTSLSFNSGTTLTIDGQGLDANVVINVNRSNVSGPHFSGAITLAGGLTPDNVIFNLIGGNNTTLSGGPTLQTAANRANQYVTYLNPTGTINVNAVNIFGHLFGGDSSNMQITSGGTVTVPEPDIAAMVALGGISMMFLLGKKPGARA